MQYCPECGNAATDSLRQCRHCGTELPGKRAPSYGEHPVLGLVGGLGIAVVGAIIWAIVTYVTGYQIGWMAVGVGFIVGHTVKILGNGSTSSFGIIGALCSLGGCVLGNLFSIYLFIAKQEGVSVVDILPNLSMSLNMELLRASFAPIDLLFYVIALYEGYRFSINRRTHKTEVLIVKIWMCDNPTELDM
jgi:hypothetical protein